jgi:glycosyltransferase involved in cell wall biosynthesis
VNAATSTSGQRRLLVVSDTLHGGLGGVVRRQAAWFAQRGWDVVVAAPPDGPAPESSRYRPLPEVTTARSVRAVARAARTARRVHRDERPDVVHVHGLRTLLIARLGGVPTPFLTFHGGGPHSTDPRGYREVWAHLRDFAPRLAMHATSVDPGLGGAWHYEPQASPMLATLDVLPFPPAASTPTIAWLGRLDEPKRPDLFVRAIARAAQVRPVVGLLAGDGPRRGEVEALVAELHAPVEVLGQVDPVPVLTKAWAAALLTDWEGTPLAVMEAMWAGRPVIGSQVPGVAHLVGDAGYLVDSAEAAARAFVVVADDHEATRACGAAAAARIRGLVSPDSPWPDVLAAYSGYLAAPNRRSHTSGS